MILRTANENEADAILGFYQNVIESIKNSDFQPKWNDNYPDLEFIKSSIEKEELYVCIDDNAIVSSFILNNEFDNDYNGVKWLIDAEADEILIIHTFAINPDFRKKGLSKIIINEIKKISSKVKTMRIDIIDGNVGAQRVFEKLGFEYVNSVEIEHYAVGLANFHLYEYPLYRKKGVKYSL